MVSMSPFLFLITFLSFKWYLALHVCGFSRLVVMTSCLPEARSKSKTLLFDYKMLNHYLKRY